MNVIHINHKVLILILDHIISRSILLTSYVVNGGAYNVRVLIKFWTCYLNMTKLSTQLNYVDNWELAETLWVVKS